MSEGLSSIPARLLNPCLLHLQKLALELKCPFCLSLFNRPMLLPCNHILCNMCIPKSSQLGSECQICKHHFSSQDVRPAPYMENIVTIYRSLDATFTADLLQPLTPDTSKLLQGSHVYVENEAKEPVDSPQEGNSSNDRCHFVPTSKKRVRASLNSLDEQKNFNGKSNENQHALTSPSNGAEFQDSKKLKNSDNWVFDGCGTRNGSDQIIASCAEKMTTSKSDSKSGEGCVVEAPKDPVLFGTNKNICVFCQSSEVKDTTGLMLHYVRGKEVIGEAAMNPNAIHVHKTCIEWTPQTYFVDDTVKNLSGEIARAAKLKCSHCGIKGAALGCYMKSCRKTYHVPCAVDISGSRWDTDDFLLLCPMHSTVKFPREKSKSGKPAREKQQPVPAAIISIKPSSIEAPPDEQQLVFCGSALSSEEKFQLVKFANHCGASVTKFWSPNVTHVIASTDSNGAYIRTLKVLKAILHGRWILKTDWIKASMEAMQPVDEEPYEVCRDKYGCCDGPKMGRLRASMENAPKLFYGLVFYFFGDFVPGYKDDLLDLVITAGGTIIKRKEDFVVQNHVGETYLDTVVVYNSDLMPEEKDHVGKERIEAAKVFANGIGCKAIEHIWLLESIASCALKPF